MLYEHMGANLMNENIIFYISYMKTYVHISYFVNEKISTNFMNIEFSIFLIQKYTWILVYKKVHISLIKIEFSVFHIWRDGCIFYD